jgi:hypothetical protein
MVLRESEVGFGDLGRGAVDCSGTHYIVKFSGWLTVRITAAKQVAAIAVGSWNVKGISVSDRDPMHQERETRLDSTQPPFRATSCQDIYLHRVSG